ncbi:MAG: SGNH/GDSL hydrolase family protein [Nitrospirota bacterium]|jgi:lysophospholipase L1-like esterase
MNDSPPIVRYIALGDSISIDDYAGGPGRGAASLLLRNRDDDFPEFHGRDLLTHNPEAQLHLKAADGATTRAVLEKQITRLPNDEGGRTVITLTGGGNDLLLTLQMRGTLLGEDAEAVVRRVSAIIGSVRNRYRDVLVVVGTIYDPTDAVGDLINPGFPLHRELSLFHQVNDGIRALTDGDRVRLADIHGHFLGHGNHHDDPANPYHDAADPTSWFTETIEPNARGASEVRRLFWQTLAEAGWVSG